MGKGSGNAGKPGKHLKLEQLQSHFGVGLKEAANRLGICATSARPTATRAPPPRSPPPRLGHWPRSLSFTQAVRRPRTLCRAAPFAPAPQDPCSNRRGAALVSYF